VTAFLLLEVCHILAIRGVEPFSTSFYTLAWWPYIFIADTLIYLLKGESPMRSRPGPFLLMLPWSVFVWVIFELYNLRLANWHYINVTDDLWLRWLGYSVSFATVLPGLFLTTELLEALGLFRGRRLAPIPRTTSWYPWFWAIGGLWAVLPLLWPVYFFPLVWGAFVLLLEPFNHRFGAPSLMADLERGDPRRIYLLLAGGAVCGLLWEYWNFWAETKWVYTVPYFSDLKLFEMPVAGFLGFPPFAVECFVMYNFILLCLGMATRAPRRSAGRGTERVTERGNGWAGLARGLLAAGIIAATCGLAYSAMDRVTVLSFLK
jgi:hypothetical protein